MDGIFNIDKPPGLSSHDVVDRVRRCVGIRRVGHAGTLDPLATGVLLICTGKATRVTEYLMAGAKRYRAGVCFGTATTTYDAEGDVVAEHPVSITEEQLEAALAGFQGAIRQAPPAYSAVKVRGQPLYKYARRGQEVERKRRSVEVFCLELSEWRHPRATVLVDCSPGTYIRSLAHDLGQALGCGAHLESLVRVRSGGFDIEDSVRLSALEAAERSELSRYLLPISAALQEFPDVRLRGREEHHVRTGRPVQFGDVSRRDLPAEPDALCRAYNREGELIALLRYDAGRQWWAPHKVFV